MPRAFTEDDDRRIRARLLEVGRERLASTGFRKTSIDALTRGAGISKGAFYAFFESKEALWMALLQEAETELRAELDRIVDTNDGPPAATLRAFFTALFDAVTVHPLLRALADPTDMAWLLRALPPGALEAARRDDDRFFAALLARLRRKGVVRRRVPTAAFLALPAAALALAQGRSTIGEAQFERFVAFQIDAWVAALAA
ncbi:MAG: TetR/AcrR family transcriptional regulator [Deltaproteobacteria bacterium]|jgi:AcrR family transcriptional regulator